MSSIICPYCNCPAKWVTNKTIYGRNIGKSFMIWLCDRCNAYCSCHKNTKKPMGTLADSLTRLWRKKAHDVLDPFWKSGKISRARAYKRLDKHFGFEVHIGESDIEMCKKIINAVKEMEKKYK